MFPCSKSDPGCDLSRRVSGTFRGDDGQDLVVLEVVELDAGRVVEDGQQVRLDGVRVGRLTEDLQQRRVRHEEEARERQPLLLQVARQRLLAHLQLLLRHKERVSVMEDDRKYPLTFKTSHWFVEN